MPDVMPVSRNVVPVTHVAMGTTPNDAGEGEFDR
jgi:hypothetical protein